MKVRINKPVPGMSYFGGEIVDMDAKVCTTWITSGYMFQIQETDSAANTLPNDLPCRDILFQNGLESLEDVRKVKENMTEIKGIGKKTAAMIVEYLETH